MLRILFVSLGSTCTAQIWDCIFANVCSFSVIVIDKLLGTIYKCESIFMSYIIKKSKI